MPLSHAIPDPQQPTPLLGGLTAQAFMTQYWQKKPLLVRQAVPGMVPLLSRAALFALAARDDVESRLVSRSEGRWQLRHGPFAVDELPSPRQSDWTLLVQGVDLHDDAVHALLRRFRFVPDARLDDVMISWASDGGGVGPHSDSYDVFLLQTSGQRRWRIAPPGRDQWVPGLPLKILSDFTPQREWLLEPGDMLYLPPHWAHDGVAVGPCMTYSIGFRRPALAELAAELLVRLADDAAQILPDAVYTDAQQPATRMPAAIPPALQAFAADAVQRLLDDPRALALTLGQWLSEPKPQVWFDTPNDAPDDARLSTGVRLTRCTRMLYDDHAIYINGESFLADGEDARLMRQLANARTLAPRDCVTLSADAQAVLQQWLHAGWLEPGDGAQ